MTFKSSRARKITEQFYQSVDFRRQVLKRLKARSFQNPNAMAFSACLAGSFIDVYRISSQRSEFLHSMSELLSPNPEYSEMDWLIKPFVRSKHLEFLVDVQRDLIQLSKSKHAETSGPLLDKINSYLRLQLRAEKVKLQRITWEGSSDKLKQALLEHESVHKMRDLEELRQRLGRNRYIFGLFHPDLYFPVNFVEVALWDKVPTSIQQILGEVTFNHKNDKSIDRAPARTYCTFYSISAVIEGLSLGGVLIKKSRTFIQCTHPEVKHFLTLSPIPTLRTWVEGLDEVSVRILPLRVQRALALLGTRYPTRITMPAQGLAPSEKIMQGQPEKMTCLDDEEDESLRMVADYYLGRVKRHDGFAYDPVARFHLSNGASMGRKEGDTSGVGILIHIKADTSVDGMNKSYGCMVNYHYDCV